MLSFFATNECYAVLSCTKISESLWGTERGGDIPPKVKRLDPPSTLVSVGVWASMLTASPGVVSIDKTETVRDADGTVLGRLPQGSWFSVLGTITESWDVDQLGDCSPDQEVPRGRGFRPCFFDPKTDDKCFSFDQRIKESLQLCWLFKCGFYAMVTRKFKV